MVLERSDVPVIIGVGPTGKSVGYAPTPARPGHLIAHHRAWHRHRPGLITALGSGQIDRVAAVTAPGLYFIGFRLPPGSLPDTRRDRPAIARRIVGRRWRRPVRSWRTSWSGYPADHTRTDLTENEGGVGGQ